MAIKTATDLINEAKGRITQVTPQQAMQTRTEHPETVLLDCREPNEWNLGRVPGALFIPRGILESNIEAAVPRDRKLVIYCASGNRSALAVETLQQMGYTDVASMSGGFRGWAEAGGDIED
ncbi:MAG: rhodanese-like domain-containing protein [Gemmatimonadaceae bacterium]